MYRYKPKEKKHIKLKRFLCLITIMILVSAMTLLLHNMYLNIEINPVKETNEVGYNLTRSLEDAKMQNVEITDVIEEVSQSVVGISKIKNTGSAIFLNESVSWTRFRNWNNYNRRWLYINKPTCVWE